MEGAPPQRVDIAQIVGEYQGKTHRQVQDELREQSTATPVRRVKQKPPKEEKPSSWYVVVDEIIEDRVTLEAWPWPVLDPLTHFLDFDLSQTKRMTDEADDIHRVVSQHRADHEPETTAQRPLRIGDVFEVTSPMITNLATWTSVKDHTKKKRAEARAALDAMATPPHAADKAEEMERMASEQQSTEEPVTGSTKAFSAV